MKTLSRLVVFFGIFSIILFFSFSCKKKEKVTVMNQSFDTTGYVRIRTQAFVSDAHTTTGELIIYSNSSKLVYVFKNFKTNDGPNLDVWLVNDINNVVSGGYLDLGDLKSIQGNFYYETPNSTASYSYIVVWCSDFSVKFGHAFTI